MNIFSHVLNQANYIIIYYNIYHLFSMDPSNVTLWKKNKKLWKITIFNGQNPLFLWPFSIAILT